MIYEVWSDIQEPRPADAPPPRPGQTFRIGVCHAVAPEADAAQCGKSTEELQVTDIEWMARTIGERCDVCRESTGLVRGA